MKSLNNAGLRISARLRTTLALLILILSVHHLSASDFTVDFGKPGARKQLHTDNVHMLSVSYAYPGLMSYSVKSEKGMFDEIFIPDAYWIGEPGMPKLPASKDLIEVPFGAKVVVKVNSYNITEYKLSDYGINSRIMPVQLSVRKDQDSGDIPFEFNQELYATDAFISHELASVEILGVLRGMRIARLTVAPVQYNPVKGVIRVYNDIELEISFIDADIVRTQYIKTSTWSPYFEVVRNSLLNDPIKDYPAHPDLTKYPVKYLIVSPRMFEADLQPFIAWKTKKGFEVITGYTDVIGTGYSQIQSWIHAQYNAGTPENPAPSFLLIVGDTPQIPAVTGSSSAKMTDLYYASVDGDYFPEMYYGRFSATNSAQLNAQIAKTLYYEQYQFNDPAYLDKTTLIAGADATWNPRVGQPTIHYGTNNYFNSAHGYTDVYTYLTSPYTGCYNPEKIAVGFINYTAHCSETSWGDPLLTQTNVNNFTNSGMYPLAVGNCCLAADFGYAECIGETWQRAANKGSVAYIGSSPSSYWFEDFYWSVGAFPIQGTNNGYVPTFAETTWGAYDGPFVSDYVSTGGIVMIGNLAVTEVHIQGYPSHSSPLYYWQAYNVLGDPSLVAYHTQGSTNVVSHLPVFPIGLSSYDVSALPGSYVAISKDGVLLGTALVGPAGTVSVSIQPVVSSGMVDIVVTKPQHIPYMQQVPAAALEGPYITLDSYVINDAEGNNNGQADYNETFSIHISLKNVGSDPSGEVIATITGSDPYITLISDPMLNFGIIVNGTMNTLNDAYTFEVSSDVPDQYLAQFELQMTDGTGNWTSNLSFIIQAPAFEIESQITIDDAAGNNNGQPDPGETINLIFTIANSGHSDAQAVECYMSSLSSYLILINDEFIIPFLAAGQTTQVTFPVSLDLATPIGTVVGLELNVSAGSYETARDFTFKVGLILEDFETGNFTKYPWTHVGNQPWIITSVDPFEGIYSAKSGAITHSQTSQLILNYEVAIEDEISFYRKVSSESNYDYLKFYINNTLAEQWSGTVAWGKVTYPVTAGLKIFKWEYMKDGSLSSGSDCAWIDFIQLPPTSTCPLPGSLNAGSVTDNSALISWMPGGNEIVWDLLWGAAGFNPDNAGTLVEGLTAPQHSITGLSPITNYQVYVRAHCGPGVNSAWSGPLGFTTQCGAIILPYVENFTSPQLTCWSYPDGQGNWAIGNSYTPPSTQSGQPNAYFSWSPSVNNYSYSFVTPLLDGTGALEIKMDYILLLDSYSMNTVENLSVEYKASDGSAWLLLENFSNIGLGNQTLEYVRMNQLLSGMEGKRFQIRFRAWGAYSYNIDGWGLDDINIHAIFPQVPENRIVENIVLDDSDVECFDATNHISVSNTVVRAGASAEFRAGASISFLNEFAVESGGYMHAMITDEYCTLARVMVNSKELTDNNAVNELNPAKFFKVFPNPTTGLFNIELLGESEEPLIMVEVYNMTGDRLMQIELHDMMRYEFNLTEFPGGIYLIRVLKGKQMGVERLIKQ